MSERLSRSSTKYGPSVFDGDSTQASAWASAAIAVPSPAACDRPSSLPSRPEPTTYTAPAAPARPSSFRRLNILFSSMTSPFALSRRMVEGAAENALRGA
jgi:hypothetical protein